MIRYDLEAAGIPYRDEQGRQFDFHALRHQFISMLAAAGVHPKTAQELARHSSITLTMDHYTLLRVNDLTSALNTLPSLTPAREAKAATGTDDARPVQDADNGSSVVAHMVALTADISCDSVTSIETTEHPSADHDESSGDDDEPPPFRGNEADCEPLSVFATACESGTNQEPQTEPKWRNWQTRWIQNPVPVTGVRVRVPPSAFILIVAQRVAIALNLLQLWGIFIVVDRIVYYLCRWFSGLSRSQ